jgi:hypothetical protein
MNESELCFGDESMRQVDDEKVSGVDRQLENFRFQISQSQRKVDLQLLNSGVGCLPLGNHCRSGDPTNEKMRWVRIAPQPGSIREGRW